MASIDGERPAFGDFESVTEKIAVAGDDRASGDRAGGARFCPRCGEGVAGNTYCASCGLRIAPDPTLSAAPAAGTATRKRRAIGAKGWISLPLLLVVLGLAAAGGYVLGHAGGPSLSAARSSGIRAGTLAGSRDGRSAGYRLGYAATYHVSYQRAYRGAYAHAYRAASK
jgi:hypothetical protein